MGRLVRFLRRGGSAWWLVVGFLVVVLWAPHVVPFDQVPAWAQGSTDTTAVGGLPRGGGSGAGEASGQARSTDTTLAHGSGAGSGQARSSTSCSSGQTYFEEYGGCRPTTCPNGRISSTGYCRACPSPTQFHNGTGCVERPYVPDRNCPEGQQFYDSYDGCRDAGPCPGGRDNFGYCLPIPEVTVPTTPLLCDVGEVDFNNYYLGDLNRRGCRPESCENGRNLFTGWCRACLDTVEYHDGMTGCVVAEGGDTLSVSICTEVGSTPADGFMYNGFYNDCIEITCPAARPRNVDTGLCAPETVVTTPSGAPDPPQNVTANGYTPSVATTSDGIARISWDAPPSTEGIDGYRVRYLAWEDAHLTQIIINDSAWTLKPTTLATRRITGTSYAITGLELKTTYMVQVQAYDLSRDTGDKNSDWSPIVYVYPTSREVGGSSDLSIGLPYPGDPITVPGVHRPLDGRNLTYTDHICENLLLYPTAMVTEIDKGIAVWADVVDTLQVNANTKNCRCSEWHLSLATTDHLVIVDTALANLRFLCEGRLTKVQASSGCIRIVPKHDAAGNRIGDQRHMVIVGTSDYTDTVTKGCRQMFRVAMHEAGHAFGVSHGKMAPTNGDYSVMWMEGDSLCTLTEHDVFAITAIYENGQFTSRYVND